MNTVELAEQKTETITELAHKVVDAYEGSGYKEVKEVVEEIAIYLGRKEKPLFANEIGTRIRQMREELGMSQDEIIEAAGIEWSQSYVSELENAPEGRKVNKTTIEKYKAIRQYFEEVTEKIIC